MVRRPKRFWVRPWLSARRRLELGHYHRLMRELRMEDTTSFFSYLRMQPAMFDEWAPESRRRTGHQHVCDHKRFCCVRATLLLIIIRLHNDHEVQVAMYRRFAMTTFSPRKFCTSSKIGPALPDLGDFSRLAMLYRA